VQLPLALRKIPARPDTPCTLCRHCHPARLDLDSNVQAIFAIQTFYRKPTFPLQGDDMFKKIALVLCFVLTCSTAFGGVKEHQALAVELIKITEGDKVMEKMKGQVTMIFQQITAQMNVQEADRPKLENYSKRFEAILAEDMAWEKIKDRYVELYTSVFTEEETKGLVDFYNSDLGKKVTAKMPDLMQQSMTVARTYMQTVIPKLEKLTEEMRQDFAPEAASAPDAQAAPAEGTGDAK
jgi:hypothetical protein